MYKFEGTIQPNEPKPPNDSALWITLFFGCCIFVLLACNIIMTGVK